MNVVVRAMKRRAPREIIVAVPVAPPETVAALEQVADRVVCPSQPRRFLALGYHYLKFPQLSDDEVIAALRDARERHRAENPVGRNKVPKREKLHRSLLAVCQLANGKIRLLPPPVRPFGIKRARL